MAARKVEYVEIGRAELKVDCYGGKTCDQHKPEWHGHFEGDREGGKIGKQITLNVAHFRPGTLVLIQEPICPACEESREMCEQEKSCKFDWKAWEEERYA